MVMMKNRAYRKDILRTIWNGKKRFLSIAVIATLGVTMMCGLRASCVDLRRSADRFFDDQQLFDIQILSTLGLTDDDVTALASLDEVESADGGYTETAYTRVEEMQKSIDIRTLSEKGFNEPYLLEGRLPEAAGEIAVTENYLKQSGKAIGDTLQLSQMSEYLVSDTYTITGTVIDTLNVNSSEGSMGFRSVSASDYAGYVASEAVDSEVYTVVYLSLKGTAELNCYSDEYEDAVGQVKTEIETKIKSARETARFDEVQTEAIEEWQDGKAEADEEFAKADAEIADARSQIEDARQELEDGKAQITAGWQTIAENRQKIADGKAELESQKETAEKEIADARAQIEDGYAKIEEGRQTLADTYETLQNAQAQLDSAQAQLDTQKSAADRQFADAEQQLADAKAQLEAGQAQYDEGLRQYEAAKEAVQPQIDALEAQLTDTSLTDEERASLQASLDAIQGPLEQTKATLDATKAQLDASREALEASEEQLASQKTAAQQQFDAAQKEIDANQAALDAGMEQYEAGLRTLEESEKALDEGKAELEQREADAKAQIEEAEQELADGEAQLADGANELLESETKISDGEKELADAEQELADNVAEYEEEKADAEKELSDAWEEIEDLDMAKWYVQDRTSLSGYSNIKSDAASIQSLGDVFPVLFLIVAILISLTTITRMVEEERGLIGTYKALGFSNREIRRKYMIYAATATLIGGIIGDVGGYLIIPAIIFIVFRVMYMLPAYSFHFDLAYGLGGIVLFEAGIVCAAAYTCHRTLRKMPAKLMRPKSPKSGSRVLLERIPFIWKRLTFLQKVTARNLFRYKKRLVMTIFGIAGCMTLLLCGFTIKNTVSEMPKQQYEVIDQYDLMAVANDDDFASLEKKMETDAEIASYVPVRIESAEVVNADGQKETVQLITVPEGYSLASYVTLKDEDGTVYSLRDGDVFLTRNAAEILGFSVGDNITVRDLDLTEANVAATQIIENYLGNMVCMTESTYTEQFGDFAANGVLALYSEQCADPSAYADDLAREDGILSAVSTDAMEEEFSSAFALMNMVVYVILVLAALLALAVLFTLSNTNISERVRELATIKVLGFYNMEVHSYVNKETMILTFLGVLVGMPAGYFFGRYLMGTLELSSVQFYIALYPQSYFLAAAITMIFAVIVKFITDRILDKIDMVEALKSVE